MADILKLEKTIWTDADFDKMSWHDNPIYAFSINDNFELLLDIDYIFKWVHAGKKHFNFWMSPCTLIFENVYDIKFESANTQLTIDFINKQDPQKPKNSDHIGREWEYDWDIVMVGGEMCFKSVGYKMFVRREPILSRYQKLSELQRGGISFANTYEV